MLDSGFRISDLNNIPVNGKDEKFKNRIALDNTYLLSYAHTVYGINYNKHNYKIPLMSIRDDIKGYIGIESLVAPWSEQLKLWHGSWNNPSIRNKSYVYQWTDADKLQEHYAPEKFEDKENSYFIIKDAPYPFESNDNHNRNNGEVAATTENDGTVISINIPIAAEDPHPDSNKIVTKSYIDERLAGERIVEVEPTFAIRDYECTYIIRSEALQEAEKNGKTATIKILYPEKFEDRICHNKLKFTLMLEGIKKNDNLYVSSLKNNPNWIIEDSTGNSIDIVWLNDSKNEKPDVTEDLYYDNAQYLIIRFESITNSLLSEAIIKELPGVYDADGNKVSSISGYKVIPDYGVFALCENALYRSSGIKTCNDIAKQYLYITSDDESVTITSADKDAGIYIDLSVPEYNFISSDKTVNIESNEDKTYDFSVDFPKVSSTNDLLSVELEDNTYKLTVAEPESIKITSEDSSIKIKKEGSTYDLDVDFPKVSSTNDLLSVELEDNTYKLTVAEPESTKITSEDRSINISTNNSTYDLKVNFPDFPSIEASNGLSSVYDSNKNSWTLTPHSFKSSDGSIKIDEIGTNFDLTVNFPTTAITIEELSNNIINLGKVYNKKYWKTTDIPNLDITFDATGLDNNETITTELLYKSTVDSTISGKLGQAAGFSWVSSIDDSVPTLKANRLYLIEFIYYPAFGNIPAGVYARIKWFKQL